MGRGVPGGPVRQTTANLVPGVGGWVSSRPAAPQTEKSRKSIEVVTTFHGGFAFVSRGGGWPVPRWYNAEVKRDKNKISLNFQLEGDPESGLHGALILGDTRR